MKVPKGVQDKHWISRNKYIVLFTKLEFYGIERPKGVTLYRIFGQLQSP